MTSSAGHVRVWTKCFLEEKIEKIDIKHDFGGKILDTAARKIVDGYLPPIALLEEGFNFDEAIEIIAWEAIANLGNIEPSGRIYYEIGCSEKMLRELSIQIASNGRGTSGLTCRGVGKSPRCTFSMIAPTAPRSKGAWPVRR